LSLIQIYQLSSLLVVRCPIRLNYLWDAVINLSLSIPLFICTLIISPL